LFDPFVVNVPARSVQEVEVMRDLNEPDSAFDQSAGQQTSLPELSPILISQIGLFLIELKAAIELRSAESEALINRLLVIDHRLIGGGSALLPQPREKTIAAGLTLGRNALWSRKPCRSLS